MHDTYNHNNTLYTLSTDKWSPSTLREVADQLVQVDFATWAMATEWECSHARKRLQGLGACVSTHEVIGEYFEDLTHWCDIEHKIEYMSDERVLLAPSKTMKQFTVDYTFEDIAAELGYTEYAA